MPYYIFENPVSKETKEIFFKMTEEKVFMDEKGLKWQRVYSAPQIGVDVNIDPYSKKSFMKKSQKPGNIGNLFDLSKELSEKRGGTKNDPVKKDFVKNWKKNRNKQ